MTTSCDGCAAVERFLADATALGFVEDALGPDSLRQHVREAFHGRGTSAVWLRIDLIVRALLLRCALDGASTGPHRRLAQFLTESGVSATSISRQTPSRAAI